MNDIKVKYSFAEWCRDNNRQDYLELWDYKLNDINPNDIAYKSGKKYYFKCPMSLHASEERQILSISRRNLTPYCFKCNSLGQYMVDCLGEESIGLYWSDKNIKTPFDILRFSKENVWIKCMNTSHPDYQISATHFSSGQRCSVCCNRKIIARINDVATTHPWCVQYFTNPDDATKCSFGSENRYVFKCPICGTEKEMAIWVLITYGFSCDMCGDGISYPNKFMYNVLLQLKQYQNITFESEKVFEWSKSVGKLSTSRIYDFWINSTNKVIIEVHGEQHFNPVANNRRLRTLKQEQENDLFKYKLAIQNGISPENYIVIDARYSDMQYIKNSIMHSVMPKLFGFTENDIDWNQCDLCASKSLLIEACNLWNNGIHNAQKISSMIGVSNVCVIAYLKRGTNIGLCSYNPRSKIPILCLDNQYVFSYALSCEKYSERLFRRHIQARCFNDAASGRREDIDGFQFTYITREEFYNIKETEPHRVYE